MNQDAGHQTGGGKQQRRRAHEAAAHGASRELLVDTCQFSPNLVHLPSGLYRREVRNAIGHIVILMPMISEQRPRSAVHIGASVTGAVQADAGDGQ